MKNAEIPRYREQKIEQLRHLTRLFGLIASHNLADPMENFPPTTEPIARLPRVAVLKRSLDFMNSTFYDDLLDDMAITEAEFLELYFPFDSAYPDVTPDRIQEALDSYRENRFEREKWRAIGRGLRRAPGQRFID